jgi:hypothetical protein
MNRCLPSSDSTLTLALGSSGLWYRSCCTPVWFSSPSTVPSPSWVSVQFNQVQDLISQRWSGVRSHKRLLSFMPTGSKPIVDSGADDQVKPQEPQPLIPFCRSTDLAITATTSSLRLIYAEGPSWDVPWFVCDEWLTRWFKALCKLCLCALCACVCSYSSEVVCCRHTRDEWLITLCELMFALS